MQQVSTKNDGFDLRVSILQMDIKWEDKSFNLDRVENDISQLSGKTDLVILPEMFTTGFSMNSRNLSEENSGKTVERIKQWANAYDFAICGSFIAKEADQFYNRGFFISSTQSVFYDKRHLFRMGDEPKSFSAGQSLPLVEHKGFTICLQICYDLRFPVWSRNVDNKYDLLIYCASWPKPRINVWDILLKARAIENMSYVCGVNRVGTDGMNLMYNGHSTIIDYKGNELVSFPEDLPGIETVTISKKELNLFRNKFPVWKDADKFTLE